MFGICGKLCKMATENVQEHESVSIMQIFHTKTKDAPERCCPKKNKYSSPFWGL